MDILVDSLLDTLKVLPVVLVVYFLMELLEYRNVFTNSNNALKGKYSPIIGAGLGCLPQCGFSVASTDLFAKGKISVGALVAVYISTSDEALPILLGSGKWLSVLMLLLTKVILGILAGLFANALYHFLFEKERHHHEGGKHAVPTEMPECCHHHHKEKGFDWVHPLLHSLKITAFILIINLILGYAIYFIGEDNITNFLHKSYYLQPLFSVIVGLIPNCASSIALTELYLTGALSFGAVISGLCVNAGAGMVLLLKEHKNAKENTFVILTTVIFSLVAGYILQIIC